MSEKPTTDTASCIPDWYLAYSSMDAEVVAEYLYDIGLESLYAAGVFDSIPAYVSQITLRDTEGTAVHEGYEVVSPAILCQRMILTHESEFERKSDLLRHGQRPHL